ncbi:MAG TPA: heparan N-sulfatase, partial [Verrucomicrobiales bacterium]|nr:heparan N-sulfatase [Verrucomicrobiales bacterium]
MLKTNRPSALVLLAVLILFSLAKPLSKVPNILFVISDDQSYPHASAYGCRGIETPGFDRVAREGVLFHTAISGSPGCSPSRASLLTGRYHWMIEHAGTHASKFDNKFATFPDLLEKAGYWIGYTGKGWGP